MSKYETLKNLSDSDFRRLTGVKHATFNRLVDVLTTEIIKNKQIKGRPSALSVADQVLIFLEYNREYRTYFHIAKSYEISEPTAYRLITRAENLLIRSGQFSLEGKKALLEGAAVDKVVIIDVTETKIQRPKKNKKNTIQPKKSITT